MPRGRPKGSKNKPKSSAEPVKRNIKIKKDELTDTDVQTFELTEEETESKFENINPFQITVESCACQLEPISEWANMIATEADSKTKLGLYSSCRLPIKNAKKVYPVVAYIQTDIKKYRNLGFTDKQIFLGCINYLSINQSKSKLKRFGDLYPYSFKIINDKISAMFLTTEQKSKMFWGEGTK